MAAIGENSDNTALPDAEDDDGVELAAAADDSPCHSDGSCHSERSVGHSERSVGHSERSEESQSGAGEGPPDLAAALAELNIALPTEQIAAIERYCHLLWEWNEKLNLTRHCDFRTFAARDVVDSLAFAKVLEPRERVLDVGTGGGVPGVLLAILRPDVKIELSESIAKKARALEDIVGRLGLKVPVHHARAEDLLARGRPFDTLTIRAVARLDKLLTWFNPHWGRFRRMLVLKGPSWVEERKACRERQLILDLDLRRVHSYKIPGTQAESVLLQLTPKAAKA